MDKHDRKSMIIVQQIQYQNDEGIAVTHLKRVFGEPEDKDNVVEFVATGMWSSPKDTDPEYAHSQQIQTQLNATSEMPLEKVFIEAREALARMRLIMTEKWRESVKTAKSMARAQQHPSGHDPVLQDIIPGQGRVIGTNSPAAKRSIIIPE
jgi:hypothetical protein